MKIYRFNAETGAYLGEDFADEEPMSHDSFIVPADATAIAPPSPEKGYILVFDVAEQQWQKVAISIKRAVPSCTVSYVGHPSIMGGES